MTGLHLINQEPSERTSRARTTANAEYVDVTVIVPTRDEEATIDELVERIRRTLGPAGYRYEILFVDDSDDRTPEAIAWHEEHGPTVRLVHRRPGTRAAGPAGALCAGFAAARGRVALCIDADLQHPPELLAPMARVLLDGSGDVVVGTRYLAGGADTGMDSRRRRCAAAAARDLTRLALPRLRRSTDPGSGLFGLCLDVLDGVDLRPRGFRILVDVLAKGRWRTLVEIPYHLEPRRTGTSHASATSTLRSLRHLARLARDPASGRAPRAGSGCRAVPVPNCAPGQPIRSRTVVLRHDED